MECMNCHKEVEPGDAKIFAEVFCCPTCFTIAERTYKRLEGELRKMLVMSRETIRVALVEGKLHLPEGETQDVSKEDVLRMIVQMTEKKHADEQR